MSAQYLLTMDNTCYQMRAAVHTFSYEGSAAQLSVVQAQLHTTWLDTYIVTRQFIKLIYVAQQRVCYSSRPQRCTSNICTLHESDVQMSLS